MAINFLSEGNSTSVSKKAEKYPGNFLTLLPFGKENLIFPLEPVNNIQRLRMPGYMFMTILMQKS